MNTFNTATATATATGTAPAVTGTPATTTTGTATGTVTGNLNLYTVYTFDTDCSEIENENTYTFTQNVRKNAKGERLGDGVRLVINKPAYLTPPIGLNSKIAVTFYEYGASELLKDFLRKEVKDKATGFVVSAPTEQAILAMLEASGTKLLTKASIEEVFNTIIADAVFAMSLAKGIDENNTALLEKTKMAYMSFFLKLARPATKYADEIKAKLLEVLELIEDYNPVIEALKARLSKDEPEKTDLAEFL